MEATREPEQAGGQGRARGAVAGGGAGGSHTGCEPRDTRSPKTWRVGGWWGEWGRSGSRAPALRGGEAGRGTEPRGGQEQALSWGVLGSTRSTMVCQVGL